MIKYMGFDLVDLCDEGFMVFTNEGHLRFTHGENLVFCISNIK